jgi:hypothetical protein
MRSPTLLVLLAAITAVQAFVPPLPLPTTTTIAAGVSSRRIISNDKPPKPTTVSRLSPFDVADALVAAADTDYEYGAFAAPGELY